MATMMMLLVCGALAQVSAVNGISWSGPCDVLPVDGCLCYENYGIMVSCVNLGLTSFPSLNASAPIHTLDLSGNSISRIVSDAVDPSLSIQKLMINHNSVSSLSADFFFTVPFSVTFNIKAIEMDDAGFTEVPHLSTRFSGLRKLSLRDNRITILNIRKLSWLLLLTELYLSGNPITVLQHHWDYDVTPMNVFDISWAGSIGSSILYDQALTTNGTLISLSIESSQFVLSINLLMEFFLLESLAIVDCGLDDAYLNEGDVPTRMRSYGTLHDVIIADNRLTRVPNRFVSYIPNLYNLDISHNSIERVEDFDFRSNSRLTYIDLSYNHIRFIDNMAFFRDDVIEPLREVDLSHNQLTALDQSAVQGIGLLIGQNPWSCDCDVEWLIDLIGREADGEPGPLDPYEIFHDLRCSSPDRFSGSMLLDLYTREEEYCQ